MHSFKIDPKIPCQQNFAEKKKSGQSYKLNCLSSGRILVIYGLHILDYYIFSYGGGGLLVFQSGLRIWGTQRMPTAYSYAFFFVKISQYSRFYKLIICKISNRSVSLRLLKIFYSPFQVKQSKLCHYID